MILITVCVNEACKLTDGQLDKVLYKFCCAVKIVIHLNYQVWIFDKKTVENQALVSNQLKLEINFELPFYSELLLDCWKNMKVSGNWC